MSLRIKFTLVDEGMKSVEYFICDINIILYGNDIPYYIF